MLLGTDHPLTASLRPATPGDPSPAMRAVTRRQEAENDRELEADISSRKLDEVKLTSFRDTVSQVGRRDPGTKGNISQVQTQKRK